MLRLTLNWVCNDLLLQHRIGLKFLSHTVIVQQDRSNKDKHTHN